MARIDLSRLTPEPLIIAGLLIAFATLSTFPQIGGSTTEVVTNQCSAMFPRLTELQSKLRVAYAAGKFDDAYKIAMQMSEIGDANCDTAYSKRLSLYLNVAQIQVKRHQFKEAREIYDKNLGLAESVYGEDSEDLQKYINDLLKLSADTVGIDKFESYALKLLETKRKRFGSESPEVVWELSRMARFYEAAKKIETAEKFYLESLDIGDRLPVNKASVRGNAINRYRVYLIRQYGEPEGLKRGLALMMSRYPDNPNRDETLNGMAYFLPKPAYTFAARNLNAKGQVQVEITIDERGHVKSAKAVSGHPILRPLAEEAIRMAKFLPTFFHGQIVEVKGVVTYNFLD